MCQFFGSWQKHSEPTFQNRIYCCPRVSVSGYPMTTYAISYPTWWINWTFRQSRGCMKGRSGSAALSPADDDEDPALRLLRGGIFVAQDPEAIGGGRRFSSIGSGESAGLPHHCGLSETSSEGAGRAVPADVTADVRDRGDEVGAGGPGWEQGEGPREQAQSDELQTDEGNREAVARGSSEVVEPSRGSGQRRG